MGQIVEINGAAQMIDVEQCYKYILGRQMNDQEILHMSVSGDAFAAMNINELRKKFFQSAEFHARHLEIVFENLMPQSRIVKYKTGRGFEMYLDLRQLHLSFGVLNEIYEKDEVDLIRKIVRADDVFFDIGANCGYYSLSVAAAPDFRGRVVAFEPVERLRTLLMQSIEANGFEGCITVQPLALADQPGMMPITNVDQSINPGATMLAFEGLPADRVGRSVPVETLDRIVGDLKPDVMKIDIQGAEALFFRGAERTIGEHRPTLFFEVAPELLALLSKAVPGDLQRWLVPRGYKLWKLESSGLRPIHPSEDLTSLVGYGEVADILAVHNFREAHIRARLGDLP